MRVENLQSIFRIITLFATGVKTATNNVRYHISLVIGLKDRNVVVGINPTRESNLP